MRFPWTGYASRYVVLKTICEKKVRGAFDMGERPEVKPGDWVTIGTSVDKDAVVCHIYEKKELADIKVVYLDDLDRAVNDDLIWKDDHWEFKHPGPSGGYADKYGRLSHFVAQLRRGRYI